MSFTSFEFIAFFTAIFVIYWLPFKKSKHYQNIVLIIASLFFYGYANWKFSGLLILTSLSTFFAGQLMSRYSAEKKRQILSFFSIAINIGILFTFKYYNFFITSASDIATLFGLNVSLHTLNLLLPIGISFYTFSALSYSIDVYQKKVEATNDLLAYLAYVTFFPSLLSGPIGRATKQLPQFSERRVFNYEKAALACRMILLGAFVKICLADRLGAKVDGIYADVATQNGSTLFLYSILYTIQIYCDFAGYSMIAIGCGKLLGIELQTNFERPYLAKTVTDFWRRWHISLTTWFRDYIYFPLGGNRVNRSRWIVNTMIVFIVSGLWHGADYTFLIWGALHGICMVVERIIYGNKIKRIDNKLTIPNIFRTLITFLIVSFAWIFFRADNIHQAWTIISKIFLEQDINNLDVCGRVGFILSCFLISICLIYELVREYKLSFGLHIFDSNRFVRWSCFILVILTITLLAQTNQNFIYFQF